MGKCSAENRLARYALRDFEGKVKIPRLSRLRDAGVDFTPGVLKTEPKLFVQGCPGLYTVVDEADIDPSLR